MAVTAARRVVGVAPAALHAVGRGGGGDGGGGGATPDRGGGAVARDGRRAAQGIAVPGADGGSGDGAGHDAPEAGVVHAANVDGRDGEEEEDADEGRDAEGAEGERQEEAAGRVRRRYRHGERAEARVHVREVPALLRLELQPEPAPQVRVRQGERVPVRQVRKEVPAQAELRLPPEAQAQDRVRHDRPVRRLGAGGLPGAGGAGRAADGPPPGRRRAVTE